MSELEQEQRHENGLHPPSEEQKNIIDLLEKNNVIVDSVAGSGKTTTTLHIALRFFDLKILLLTYNSKLKMETREKIAKYGITNIEVHSYHSFCVKYYDKKCFRDNEIKKVIDEKKQVKTAINYDLIILDEAQDITPLYYSLIRKVYNDNCTLQAKICVLGDKNQSIYDFNNADNRFIIYANNCFAFNNFAWQSRQLSESFRITKPMANFVNNCMLNKNRIQSRKKGILPYYVICNTFGDYYGKVSVPFQKMQALLDVYEPQDIFILAPSIKSSSSPARKLENKLKTEIRNIPIYVPNNDDETIDSTIIENKLVISTFHQTKGLERKAVIVFGFDNSYFMYYKKGKNPKICANELYVACTRASECLIMFHHHENDFLPFINRANINNCAYFQVKTQLAIKENNRNENVQTSPTDLCNHLPDEIVTECMKYFTIKKITPKEKKINIKLKSKQNNTIETVSEINGSAIPLYFEYLKKGKINIMEILPDDENRTMFDKKNKSDKYKNKNYDSDDDLSNETEDFSKYITIDTPTSSDKNNKTIKKIDTDVCMFDSDSDDEDEKISKLKSKKLNDKMKKLNVKETKDRDKTYKLSTININIKNKKLAIDELLYLTNRWNTFKNGYLYKIKQIKKYDWLSEDDIQKAINNLQKLNISDNCVFEYKISVENQTELLNRKIVGFIDCIDGNNIYEFKCVSELDDVHYLQLAIYAYCYEVKRLIRLKKHTDEGNTADKPQKLQYFMYNILTNELNEIVIELCQLRKMMEYLIYNKYVDNKSLTDEKFFEQISTICSTV
jgi:ATP:corrinoid adenosyltransferase